MDNKSFWLANISADSLSVSLIASEKGKFNVAAVGPEVLYQNSPDAFVAAVDQSLSDAAFKISLPEDSEPNSIALIISPFWVGSDGKIVADKIKLFESMFKELKLRPMGFISYDDAIVEEANIADGFPASFIVVKIEATSFITSLTYLGKVIERVIKPITDTFEPVLLESTLLEFKTDSTLPPQIILLGDIDDDVFEKIRSYPWIGKKNIETFLHFPEIRKYSVLETNAIYTTAITSQFQPQTHEETPVTPKEEIQEDEVEIEVESEPTILSEVTAEELGFLEADNFSIPESLPGIVSTPEPPPEPVKTIPKVSFKFSFPRFKLPRMGLPSKNILLFPLVISPLFILIPFFLSTAVISLSLTPYTFTKSLNVSLDSQATSLDLTNMIVPVKRQNFDVNNTVTIATTGRKTIGQKAQGEVVVFNKLDKTQSLPKGTVLVDGAGHKFELISAAQIASSSSNLSLGVITLGQTKVMAVASEIGTEYNLSKDTILNFKDFAPSAMVAKVSDSLNGGSKTEANAVSSADVANAGSQLTKQINAAVNEKITVELSKNPGIIKDSVQIKKGRVETNREIGEETDELTATATSTVIVFYFDASQKVALLKGFLSNEAGFNDSVFNPDNFEITLSKTKNSADKITGTITVSGKSTPVVNTQSIAKLVSGKSHLAAISIIKKALPRVYNYQISTNTPILKNLNPLPFRTSNIKITVK